jgi:peptidoglycan/LPS O-acetylase OafA/YrhL
MHSCCVCLQRLRSGIHFFVISGFLITSNLLTRWRRLEAINIRAFYVQRASRILPCLLILVTVLSILHLAGASDFTIARPGQSLSKAIFSALGLYLNWYEGHTGYLPGNWDVLWSLSIEEVFYLAFPLFCCGMRRIYLIVPALTILAFSLPISHAALARNEIWQEKAYLPGMAAVATGVLGALLAFRFQPKPSRFLLLLQWMSAIGIIVIL